jgi:hypothetical protein
MIQLPSRRWLKRPSRLSPPDFFLLHCIFNPGLEQGKRLLYSGPFVFSKCPFHLISSPPG